MAIKMKNGMRNSLKVLVEPTLAYDSVGLFHEGLAAVYSADEEVGFIDKSGKPVIPLGLYDKINPSSMIHMRYDFREGLSAMVKYGKWGYIDKTGQTAAPFIYDFAQQMSEGIAAVKKQDKWGILQIEESH